MRGYFLLVVLLASFTIGYTQEQIISVGSNIATNSAHQKKSIDTLSLPFWDDFSSLQITDNLWDNHGCKIDLTGSVNPPSIGTVEFDALDSAGNFYGTYEQSVVSDMLTSKPINLYYPDDKSVYFSFMYEPGGLKDMPDKRDSLILQFYTPVDKKWTTVWYALGGDSLKPEFHQVILHVDDPRFLQKGFRFRFKAYSSLGSASFPSLVSDCDFWYVDYVYLNRNRYAGDTIYRDVALQYPMEWKFDDYTAMPFSHYQDKKQEIAHHVLVKFRNNDGVGRTVDSLYIVFADRASGSVIDTLFLGSYSFPPDGNFFVKNDHVNYVFPQLSQQDIEINAETKLITDQFDPKGNNQSQSTIYLTNFYAYDDGSAEAGYGLYGDGTFQSLVAARFYTYKADYLRGVKIYFNKTYSDRQPRYFYLMVWENDPQTGKPGKLIYKKSGMAIDFDKFGQYQTYYLDTNLTVTDTFYVGWEKTDEQLMNVGLDLNDVKPNYKFYNITGKWEASSIPGNLMIRPIMGHIINTSVAELNEQLKIYPNPAHDVVIIATTKNLKIQVYSMQGQLVKEILATGQTRLNVSDLQPGLYVLRAYDNSGKTFYKKLIIR